MSRTTTSAEGGKVYLVGAGPGDPELLTVRAAALLASADCIFYDDLVPVAILHGVREDALVRNVGKRSGRKSITQEEINGLLIEAAHSEKSVVRLKIGDPMLFGRAGEELEALRAASIPCEVVPGVTAAFAAAASLQTPLTDRRHASKMIFLTGHHAETNQTTPHWERLPHNATLAIYMPGSNYEQLATDLLEAGISADTPCAIISHSSLSSQQVAKLRISEMASHPPLPAPAIVLVGAAVKKDR